MIEFSEYCRSASVALNFPTDALIPRQSGQSKKNAVSGQWFQDVWAKKLLESSNETIQTVFTGMPSTGKSTELKRLATELNKKVAKTQHVVHLFLIQNDFSSGSGIYSVDDLWRAIMRCHASEKIRERSHSIDEFINLHKDNQAKPILLIDTLDVLPYGVVAEEQAPLVEFWRHLVEKLVAANIHTIWTCRTMEAKLFKSEHVSTQKIPRLHARSVDSLVRSTPQVLTESTQEKDSQYVIPACILSIHAFPILSQFFGAQEKRFFPYDEYFTAMFKAYFHRMRLAPVPQQANPIAWAMELQDQMLPVDVMYEVLRDKIISFIREDGLEIVEDKRVEEHWVDLIEQAFFRVAVYNPHDYGSRLLIPRENDEDSPEISTLKSEIFYLGEKLGLFTLHPNKVAFTHQLFAEYCLHRCVANKNFTSDEIEEFLQRFPSLRIKFFSRMKQEDVDPLWEAEYENWISAYVAACPLYEYKGRLVGAKWEKAISLSEKVYGKEKKTTSLAYPNEEKPTIQQDAILGNLPLTPLFINGPAGTGKTHMAPWFIHKRMYELSVKQIGDGAKPSYGVNFFTMSPYLADHFEKKWQEYQTGILDDFVPVIQSRSIDQLIGEMLDSIGDSSAGALDFTQNLLIESRFIRLLTTSRHKKIEPLLNRYSPHGLWNEYLKNIISEEGRPAKNIEEYRQNLKHSMKKMKKHGKHLEPNSIFYQFNNEKSTRSVSDSNNFWEILGALGLVGPAVQLKTRQQFAKEVSERVLEIHNNGSVEMRERLLQFTSEVTVVDEIQDLHTCIVELLLLLHDGDVSAFMAMGDEDQTLDYEVFTWEDFLDDLDLLKENWEDTPSRQTKKWIEGNFSDIEIHYLVDVERSVPDIVKVIQNAYSTAVSVKFLVESGTGKGTAATRPGHYSIRREKEYKRTYASNNVGVSFIENPITKLQLLSLIRKIYHGKTQAMVIFPSFNQHTVWSNDYEANYPIALWHPVSVKGLESDLVIAMAPWSIDKEMLDRVLAQYETADRDKNWEALEAVATKRGNENLSYKSRFENVVSQRRRHGNVMISRAKRHLVVVSMLDEDFDMLSTDNPTDIRHRHQHVNNISLDQLFDILDQPTTVDDKNSKKPTWYSELKDLIQFLIRLVQSDSEGHLLRNISLSASHILYAADDDARETQAIRPVMWAMEMMRGDPNKFADELDSFGFEPQSGMELMSLPALLLTRSELVNLPNIGAIIEKLRNHAKCILLNDNDGDILVPLSTYSDVDELMQSLVSTIAWLKLPFEADVDADDIQDLHDWIIRKLHPPEHRLTAFENWRNKLDHYDFDENQLRIPSSLSPSINNPSNLLKLFWPMSRDHEVVELEDAIAKLKKELDDVYDYVNEDDNFTKDDAKAFVDTNTPKMEKLKQKLEHARKIAGEPVGVRKKLLRPNDYIQVSDDGDSIVDFWSKGLALLRKDSPDSANLHDLWNEISMKLGSAEIKSKEQLDTLLFLATSILRQKGWAPSEFIEVLSSFKIKKNTKSSPLDGFLPPKFFKSGAQKRIKSSLVRMCLKQKPQKTTSMLAKKRIDMGKLLTELDKEFTVNLHSYSEYIRFVSLVSVGPIAEDFMEYTARNREQLLLGDAMPVHIQNQVRADYNRKKKQIKRKHDFLAIALVGDKVYSQFKTPTDLKSILKSVEKHPVTMSMVLSTILIRLNSFANLTTGLAWKEELALLDEIKNKTGLDKLIEKHLDLQDITNVFSGVGDNFPVGTADYMRLFTQTSSLEFDENLGVVEKARYDFFREISKKWEIGYTNKRAFQDLETLSLPLFERARSEWRRILNNPKEPTSRILLEDAGYLDKKGDWIGGVKPDSEERNYYSENEVGKVIAKHIHSRLQPDSKMSMVDRFEQIQNFVNEARDIINSTPRGKSQQARLFTEYKVRFGRDHSSPAVDLNAFFGLTEVLVCLKKFDLSYVFSPSFEGENPAQLDHEVFDEVFTLQNFFKHILRDLEKRSTSKTNLTNMRETVFFNVVEQMFGEVFERIKKKSGRAISPITGYMDNVKLRLQGLDFLLTSAISGCTTIFRSLYHAGTVFHSYVRSRKSPIPLGTVFIGRDKSELKTSLGYVSFMSFLEGTQFTDMRTTRFLRYGIE